VVVPAAGTTTQLQTIVPLPSSGRVGMEMSHNRVTRGTSFGWWMRIFTGSRLCTYRVKYVYASELWYYMDDSGAWVALNFTAPNPQVGWLYRPIKLVVDPTTEEYVRLRVGSLTYNFSGAACQGEDDSGGYYLQAVIELESLEGYTSKCRVDDVVFTSDEP
jgi:hypothetical protein